MLDTELIKYVALQMLILAGSLNENLTKSGLGAVLPITFGTSPVPSNLPVLISDASLRVAAIALANKPVLSVSPTTPGVGNAAGQVLAAAPAAVAPVVAHSTNPAVAAVPATPAINSSSPGASAVPPAPVAHASAPPAVAHHRRRRSLSGAVSEIADSVSRVASDASEHPVLEATGVSPVFEAVASVADQVENDYKPPTTNLGELILS